MSMMTISVVGTYLLGNVRSCYFASVVIVFIDAHHVV